MKINHLQRMEDWSFYGLVFAQQSDEFRLPNGDNLRH